jgi:hypothetical protein
MIACMSEYSRRHGRVVQNYAADVAHTLRTRALRPRGVCVILPGLSVSVDQGLSAQSCSPDFRGVPFGPTQHLPAQAN